MLRPWFLVLALLSSLHAVAAGRPVAPRPIVAAPYPAYGASTAFAAGRFLSVWIYDTRGAGAHIVGALSDAEGRRISPSWFRIAEFVQASSLQLVSTGDAYVLFIHDRNGVTSIADVDANGRLTGVAAKTLTFPFARAEWNGTHFIALRANLPESEAVIFDRDGTILRREALPPAYVVRAVPLGDGFLTLTLNWSGLFAQRLSAGSAGPQWTLDAGTGTTSGYLPKSVAAVAMDGGALVVWTAGRYNEIPELKSAIVGDGGPEPARTLMKRELFLHALIATGAGYRLICGDPEPAVLDFDRDGAAGELVPLAAAFSISSVASNGPTALVLGTSRGSLSTIAVPPAGAPRQTVISLAPARQSEPLMTGAGGNFIAAWTESSADAASVRAAVIAPSGETLATRTVVENASLATRSHAFNGSELLLIARRGDQFLGVRLTRDGAPLDREPFAIGRSDAVEPVAAAAWIGDRWLVAWIDHYRLFAAEISATGVAGPARELTFATGLPDGWSRMRFDVALAWNGREALIVWNEDQVAPPPQTVQPVIGPTERRSWLFAARMSDAQPLALATETARPAVASDGETFLVLTGNRGTVLRTDGGALHADPFRVLFPLPYWPASDLLWNGREYIVTSRANDQLVVQHLDRNGFPAGTPLRIPVPRPDFFSAAAPSVASDGASALIVLPEVSTAGDTQQAVIYREDELPPAPLIPRQRSARH